jgi:hypothetical protein
MYIYCRNNFSNFLFFGLRLWLIVYFFVLYCAYSRDTTTDGQRPKNKQRYNSHC